MEGPMVIAVMLAPCLLFICKAASSAWAQAGFIMPSASSRLSVPVFGFHGSSETIGTCLIHTTNFSIFGSPNITDG
jgi:hypothetical protein